MELKHQVVSLELAKRLKELGVKQESKFVYDEEGVLITRVSHARERTSAFSVAELGQFLPKNEHIVTMLFENGHAQMAIQGDIELLEEVLATRWGAAGKCIEADSEANCRAKMLIYLLENGLITND